MDGVKKQLGLKSDKSDKSDKSKAKGGDLWRKVITGVTRNRTRLDGT